MENKTKIFGVIIISLLGFFVFYHISFAATIFTDDFNSYSNGDLSGQGGWSTTGISNSFVVENSVVFEGSEAIRIHEGTYSSLTVKKGNLISDGAVTFYLRVNDYGQGYVNLSESSTNKLAASIMYAGPNSFPVGDPGFILNGKIWYRDGSANIDIPVGNIEADKWNAVQIQWKSSDHKIRYSINGGLWTPFIASPDAWSFGIDKLLFEANGSADGSRDVYFDTVQEDLFKKNPVLIVPGIAGTEMKKGNELLWADISRMLVSPSDSFMDPLALDKSIAPTDTAVSNGDVIRNPLNLFNYTDGLINEFVNQGYTENETLFTFPYDWRYGVSGKYADGTTNVDLLAKKIQDIMTQTGSNRVDVVAHSLGGLIVKKYAQDNPTSHHIGKAVFVGVPETGAPQAVKALLQGDNFGISFLGFGLSDAEMKKIAQNMPGVYDLLPSQQYYNSAGYFISTVDWGDGTGYPAEKDLNYDESKDYLIQENNLNSQALAESENLHTQSFDNFDIRTAGIDLYSIDGCKQATMVDFVETKYKDGLGTSHTDFDSVQYKIGDGTVPIESSTNLPIDQNKKYYALSGEHSKLLSQDGTMQEIVNLISGSTLPVSQSVVTQDSNRCQLNGKAIIVLSPVDVSVTDQNGNKLGLSSGNIINEIPDVSFQVIGEHKFIYLPQDSGQVYNINLQGTGSGTYTIKSQNIVNNQTIKTEVFSNLPVTSQLTGQMNINPSDNSTTLSVKQNLNDTPVTILPSAVLDASESEDLLPPVSVATLSGTVGQQNFYRSNVSINIKATDDLSGVLDVEYNLDSTGYQKISGDTATFTVSSEGQHTVTFFSTDKAGNNGQEQSTTFTIDKTAPETVIYFNPDTKNLSFTGVDNISGIFSIIDNGTTVTLTDEAGNTAELGFKEKNRKASMSAEIASIKHNGAPIDMSKNLLSCSWSFDNAGKLTKLSQKVKSRKDYSVSAVYNGTNTVLTGSDSSGKISKTVSGLKIVKVTTNNGDLQWSY